MIGDVCNNYRFEIAATVCFTILACSRKEAEEKAAEFVNEDIDIDGYGAPFGEDEHDCRIYVSDTDPIELIGGPVKEDA